MPPPLLVKERQFGNNLARMVFTSSGKDEVVSFKIPAGIKQQISFKNNRIQGTIQTLNQQVTGSIPVRLTINQS